MDIPATSDAIPGTTVLRDSTGGAAYGGKLSINAGAYLIKDFNNLTEEYILNGKAENFWQPFISYTASSGTADRGFKIGAWNNNGNQVEWLRVWDGNILTGGLTSTPGQADTNSTSGGIGGTIAMNTKRELRWFGTNASIYGGSGGADDNLYFHSGLAHIFRSNATERMRIDASGNVFIGASAATAQGRLEVTFDGAAAQGANIVDSSSASTSTAIGFVKSAGTRGSITVTATATSYNTASDYRLKENAAPLTGGLSTVSQLRPVSFKWKSDGSTGHGFIAHELQAVVPEAVTGEKDAVDADGKPKYQGVDASKLVPYLVAAVQELSARVEALEAAQ